MKSKRITAVLEYVEYHQQASIDELAEHFNVSKITIRRDINFLVQKGFIEKVYGGVKFVSNDKKAINFEQRNIAHYNEKAHIGKLAANLINENDVIYIDTGTTTDHIIENLPTNLKLTVITNSLDILFRTAQMPNVNVYVVGEKFSRRTRSFIEVGSNHLINKFNIDKAFMSATGLDIENGLSNSELEENKIKHLFANKASKLFILADHSKINKTTLLTYAPLENVDTIITDQQLPSNYRDFASNHNINILY